MSDALCLMIWCFNNITIPFHRCWFYFLLCFQMNRQWETIYQLMSFYGKLLFVFSGYIDNNERQQHLNGDSQNMDIVPWRTIIICVFYSVLSSWYFCIGIVFVSCWFTKTSLEPFSFLHVRFIVMHSELFSVLLCCMVYSYDDDIDSLLNGSCMKKRWCKNIRFERCSGRFSERK